MSTPASSVNNPEGKPAVSFVFLVGYLVALSAFGSFVNDMYSPALPSMARFFHCSVSVSQLGITMGMIGLAAGQALMGPISDKYGRKPVLVASLLIFIVGGAVSLFSPTIHFFLGCRVIQGLGASGGYFLARTIPTDLYSGRALAKTMALIGAINGFAPAVSPMIGGIVTDDFTWKGVFVVLVIFAVALLLIVPRLRESLPPARRDKGSVWLAFTNYLTLLRNRRFMVHCLLKGAALGLLFAYVSSAPFIVQNHYGFSATTYGLIIGGNAVFTALGSMAALRFKPLKRASTIAAIILIVSIATECITLCTLHNFWGYEIPLWGMLFGLGMIFTSSNTLAMNEGRASAGVASALLGIFGYIFGAVAAPLTGAGDIMHSTAIIFASLTAIIVVFALIGARFTPDLEATPK